jgi:flagellar biosynthesis protein FlhG
MPKKIVAVGGGKGGVGKSIIAANLAIAMAQKQRTVALIDTDLGGANLHTLFGIDRPDRLLEEFISGAVAHLDETLIPTRQKGLWLICGGMPVLGTANPKFSTKAKLIRHIRRLEFDVIVLDIGAGIGFNVLDLFNAAEYKIVAFTPQLTSLHNGYGFLKAAIHRRLERLIAPHVREYLQSSSPASGEESLKQVINRIGSFDPEEADKARMIIDDEKVYLVGNMLRSEKDRHVVAAIKQMIGDHLLIDAELFGVLKFGDKIEQSVNDRKPFMFSASIEYNAEVFRAMAHKIVNEGASTAPRVISTGDVAGDANGKQVNPSQYDRKEPRYPTRKLKATLACGADIYEGKILNVALGGALATFDKRMPEPAAGRLIIGPSANGLVLEVDVEERHRNRRGVRIGYAFLNLTRKQTLLIADLVAEAVAATAVNRISRM